MIDFRLYFRPHESTFIVLNLRLFDDVVLCRNNCSCLLACRSTIDGLVVAKSLAMAGNVRRDKTLRQCVERHYFVCLPDIQLVILFYIEKLG